PSRRDDFKWFLGECGDAVEGTPTTFFLNEKGEVADPKLAGIEPICGADPDRIIAGLRTVLCRYGQKIDANRKSDLEAKKAEADGCAASDPAKALALYCEIIRGGEGWSTMEGAVQAAREGRERLLHAGLQKVREALGKKRLPEETRKRLTELQAAFPGTPVASWCAKELKRLKRARRGKK
ncbi:MAG: hypothetical protein ACYTHN_19385, partial [Planctomycetota bacterium]